MKKLLLSALFIFAIAFSADAQTRFGVKAGLNIASQSYSSNSGGTKPTMSSVIGFHVGGFAEIGISKGFYVQPGLYLSSKGAKAKFGSAEATATPMYLEIPVNFGYAIDIAEGAKLHFLTGPYLAYGIGGNIKTKGTGADESKSIKWGSDKNNSDLKPMDFGWNVGATVEYKSFLFGLQYGLGLSNIAVGDGETSKNNVLGISVGYVFGGKSE